MPAHGPVDAFLIVIGEAPGANEEIEGIPFVGQSGQLLDAAIQEGSGHAYSIADVYRTNVVACRPDNNREPSYLEEQCCRPRLLAELARCSANRVLALGNSAHGAMGVENLARGVVYERDSRLVIPLYHPAYILRSPGDASEFLAQVKLGVKEDLSINPILWPQIQWMTSVAELKAALSEVEDGASVAFDIETDQIQWYDKPGAPANPILMMQLNWCDEFSIIIDDEMLYDVDGVIPTLQEFFNRVSLCGHNSKFDAVFLEAQLGLKAYQDFDTMLAHYALDETLPHGLKPIATMEFGIPDYEEATIKPYLKSKNDHYSKVPPEVLAKYGGMDVLVTRKLRDVFYERLVEEGLYLNPFVNVLMRAANGLAPIQMRGMLVDQEALSRVHDAFQIKIDELEAQIRGMAEWPDLNVRSTHQMAELLYDRLGLPTQRGRKIKNPRSTSKDVLFKLAGAHPVIPIISEYRRVAKLQSAYVDNLTDFVGIDGRVHADFKIPGTEVGRLSVADPALQTIPRAGDYYGALIRSLFVARPGYRIVVADYSQAELRVFAAISGEPFLIRVYQEGRDLHTEVALAMYGNHYTKEQRVLCKMFNFSYLYGGNEHSFAHDSGLNIEVARNFVHKYNDLMPVGLQFKKDQFALLKRQGYVSTVFGRRRHFPLITGGEGGNADEARKASVHQPCAGTASDLCLLSALDAQDKGIDVVLVVHDSVIAECREDLAEEQAEEIRSIMVANGNKYLPQVAWKADIDRRKDGTIGTRWVEMPEMENA